MCGCPSVVPLLRQLVAEMGDRLQLREHRRLAPLAAGRTALHDLARVQRGDCIVAFARKEVC